MRYLLTADEITAQEAYRLGMVQEVTSNGMSLDKAMAIAQTVAQQAPLGVTATQRSARISRIKGDQAAIERLIPDLSPLMGSEDVKEGRTSFMERREARCKGI